MWDLFNILIKLTSQNQLSTMTTYLQRSVIFATALIGISLYLKYKNRNSKKTLYKFPNGLKPTINDWGNYETGREDELLPELNKLLSDLMNTAFQNIQEKMMDVKYPHHDWVLCKNEAEKLIDSLSDELLHRNTPYITISGRIIKIIRKGFLEHFDFDIEKSLDKSYDPIIFGYEFDLTPIVSDEDEQSWSSEEDEFDL